MDLIKDFHTVNERCVLLSLASRSAWSILTVSCRIHLDAHLSGIKFFYKLIRNSEGMTDSTS